MKKVLVIGSRQSGNKNDPSELTRSLQSDEVSASLVYWEDLIFDIQVANVQVTSSGVNLLQEQIDLVIAIGWYKNGKKNVYRDMAYSLALILEHRGIKFWNSEMAHQRSTTKLSSMVQLALSDIAIPHTLFSLSFDNIASTMSYPFIAKAAAASRGDSNYLVDSDTVRMEVKQANVSFLVQQFLPNDHDLRVICFGGQPRLVLRRSRGADASTHLNNTSQGGKAAWLDLAELSPELLTFVEKISKITGREMAGVDLIPDVSSPIGYSCLEVNAVPQLTSGVDSNIKLEAFNEALKQL